MKTRFIALAAAALLASSAALAAAPAPAAPNLAKPQPVPREHTLVEELARGARDILAAAVPEIALPKLELKLPTPEADAR
jgi:hypothetical protein